MSALKGGMSTPQTEGEKARGNYEKFRAGPNPLEQEQKLDVIIPLEANQLQATIALLDKAYEGASSSQRAALDMWKMQISQMTAGDTVRLQFLRRFYFWLLGRGTEEDTKKTLWGRGNAAAHNPEVAAYIDQFQSKRTQYAMLLFSLSQRVPNTLNGFYLYFKYIVNGNLQHIQPKDGSSGFFDLSNEDYLADFDIFKRAFGDGNGTGSAPMYAPQSDETQTKFNGAEPFPFKFEDRQRYKLDSATDESNAVRRLRKNAGIAEAAAIAPAGEGGLTPQQMEDLKAAIRDGFAAAQAGSSDAGPKSVPDPAVGQPGAASEELGSLVARFTEESKAAREQSARQHTEVLAALQKTGTASLDLYKQRLELLEREQAETREARARAARDEPGEVQRVAEENAARRESERAEEAKVVRNQLVEISRHLAQQSRYLEASDAAAVARNAEMRELAAATGNNVAAVVAAIEKQSEQQKEFLLAFATSHATFKQKLIEAHTETLPALQEASREAVHDAIVVANADLLHNHETAMGNLFRQLARQQELIQTQRQAEDQKWWRGILAEQAEAANKLQIQAQHTADAARRFEAAHNVLAQQGAATLQIAHAAQQSQKNAENVQRMAERSVHLAEQTARDATANAQRNQERFATFLNNFNQYVRQSGDEIARLQQERAAVQQYFAQAAARANEARMQQDTAALLEYQRQQANTEAQPIPMEIDEEQRQTLALPPPRSEPVSAEEIETDWTDLTRRFNDALNVEIDILDVQIKEARANGINVVLDQETRTILKALPRTKDKTQYKLLQQKEAFLRKAKEALVTAVAAAQQGQ